MLVFDSPLGPEQMGTSLGRAALHMRFQSLFVIHMGNFSEAKYHIKLISSRIQLHVFMQDPVSLQISHPGSTIPLASPIFLAPPLQISSQVQVVHQVDANSSQLHFSRSIVSMH